MYGFIPYLYSYRFTHWELVFQWSLWYQHWQFVAAPEEDQNGQTYSRSCLPHLEYGQDSDSIGRVLWEDLSSRKRLTNNFQQGQAQTKVQGPANVTFTPDYSSPLKRYIIPSVRCQNLPQHWHWNPRNIPECLQYQHCVFSGLQQVCSESSIYFRLYWIKWTPLSRKLPSKHCPQWSLLDVLVDTEET